MADATCRKSVPAAPYDWRTGIISPQSGWTPPVRYLLRRSRILSLMAKLPPGRLLEIGCGSGALLCDLSHLGFTVQGLETSEKARAMGATLATLAGSAHAIDADANPGWAAAFDVVCAFDVLEHIQDQHQAMQQWLNWLTPGGRLIISVPAHRHRWGAGDEWAGHWRRYDRQDVLELARAHGLQIEHIECYGFPLANATEAIGNLIYTRMIRARGNSTKAEATASSGISRQKYSRLSGLIASPLGKAGMYSADWLQRRNLGNDLGSGYLLVACKG